MSKNENPKKNNLKSFLEFLNMKKFFYNQANKKRSPSPF